MNWIYKDFRISNAIFRRWCARFLATESAQDYPTLTVAHVYAGLAYSLWQRQAIDLSMTEWTGLSAWMPSRPPRNEQQIDQAITNHTAGQHKERPVRADEHQDRERGLAHDVVQRLRAAQPCRASPRDGEYLEPIPFK